MTKSILFYFNPTCELAVANGSFSYVPPLLLQEMEQDLATLPFVFCTKDDVVLSEKSPSIFFLEMLENCGFEIPRFCTFAQIEAFSANTFHDILPWGWSPAAHFKLKNATTKCTSEFKESPVNSWRSEHKALFERSASLDFLKKILKNYPRFFFIQEALTGKNVSNSEELEQLLEQHQAIVLKAPVSSSGRGIQIIRKTKLNESNKQWISGIFKQQKYLIAEPYLQKVIDLSFQFKILPDSKVSYSGFSIFETNSNGQYKGTLIHSDLKTILPEENTETLMEMIESTAQIITDLLPSSVYSNWHRGFLGVDAMLFRDNEKIYMQPCIEINSRLNMGVLARFIEKRVHSKSSGKFELFYGKPGEFNSFAKKQMQRNPIQMLEGKIFSGFMPLVEPDQQKKFGAYISLGLAR
ncbi:MAG: hypothetical protein WC384_19225 [Prolixibacteraceae bacterium]|jgi:hypothetical protein